MKFASLWAAALALSLGGASAQVTVEVTQEQQQFLEGESLPVAVRIINRSGQPLHLGKEADWLTFSIESREGLVVSKTGEAPVAGEFLLEASKVGIKRLDLLPYFTLSQPGRYSIVATVHIKDWGQDITSPACNFDVIEGAKLWEQEVGVPQSGGSAPEVRKYVLQQANYIRGHLRLYLRVTDSYGRTLRVVPIGGMVSFGRPEAPQVDRHSDLHVLYQNGPSSFSYTVFNPSGELIKRQVYDYVNNSRPRLYADDDGEIAIRGGVRRVAASDVPPPKSDDDDETPTGPELSAGNSTATSPASTEPKATKP